MKSLIKSWEKLDIVMLMAVTAMWHVAIIIIYKFEKGNILTKTNVIFIM